MSAQNSCIRMQYHTLKTEMDMLMETNTDTEPGAWNPCFTSYSELLEIQNDTQLLSIKMNLNSNLKASIMQQLLDVVQVWRTFLTLRPCWCISFSDAIVMAHSGDNCSMSTAAMHTFNHYLHQHMDSSF